MIKSVRRNCYCPNTVPNTVTKGVRYNSFSYPLFTVTCLKLAHGPKKKENKNTNWRNKRTELINCDWTVWTVIVVCELFWTVLIEFSVVFFTWVDCWMCPKNLQPKKPAVFWQFFGPRVVLQPHVHLERPPASWMGKNFIVEQFLTSCSLFNFLLKLSQGWIYDTRKIEGPERVLDLKLGLYNRPRQL